jgi:hypothetical protein
MLVGLGAKEAGMNFIVNGHHPTWSRSLSTLDPRPSCLSRKASMFETAWAAPAFSKSAHDTLPAYKPQTIVVI